jgi:spoIIIJ-associated protein
VRARVRPTSPRPKRTRVRRQGEQRDGARQGGGSSQGGKSRDNTGVAVVVADAGREGSVAASASTNGSGGQSTKRRRSRSRGGASRNSGVAENGAQTGERGGDEADPPRPATQQASARRKGSRPSGSTKEEAVGETMTLEEQGDSAREFVAGLIGELGLSAEVSSRLLDDETAEVVVEGQELGVLVGPGGATLAALQELARTFVQKRTGGQSSRIVVDVAGYRAKRIAALQRFAQQIAQEVTSAGSERALEPMSAADRKVVHDAIGEIGGLSTRSEGEEPRRYIVIAPQATGSPAPGVEADETGNADEA